MATTATLIKGNGIAPTLPKGTAPSAATTAPRAVTVQQTQQPAARYVLGKKYVPKTPRNSKSWDAICAAVAKGPCTLTELAKVCEGHGDFVSYMQRGGHLRPATADAPKA